MAVGDMGDSYSLICIDISNALVVKGWLSCDSGSFRIVLWGLEKHYAIMGFITGYRSICSSGSVVVACKALG